MITEIVLPERPSLPETPTGFRTMAVTLNQYHLQHKNTMHKRDAELLTTTAIMVQALDVLVAQNVHQLPPYLTEQLAKFDDQLLSRWSDPSWVSIVEAVSDHNQIAQLSREIYHIINTPPKARGFWRTAG